MSQEKNSERRDHGPSLKSVNELASKQVLTQYKVHKNITVYYGNIFDIAADAIVNAANTSLMGGAGIDGQIHARAGRHLRDWISANTIADDDGDRITPGAALVTPGFDLGGHIIHTVGPIVDGHPYQEDAEHLARCYTNVVEAAAKYKLQHVAVPCISTGIYGYPMLDAAYVALKALDAALSKHPDVKITVAVYNDTEQAIWKKITI